MHIILGAVSFLDFHKSKPSPIIFDDGFDDNKDPDSKPSDELQGPPIPPDVTYPGDDPTIAPDGYEWRGPDEQGGKRGGYANPNGKDSWHPDLDHPDGIEPHWDYNTGDGHKWRVFPDRMELRIEGMQYGKEMV